MKWKKGTCLLAPNFLGLACKTLCLIGKNVNVSFGVWWQAPNLNGRRVAINSQPPLSMDS